MGSKNRRKLGILNKYILHKIRNEFFVSELYMTDNKIKKIVKNRPELEKCLFEDEFQLIVNNIKYIYFDEDENIFNCLSEYNGKYLIFGIVPKNIRNEVTTLFYTNDRQISKKFPKDKNRYDF